MWGNRLGWIISAAMVVVTSYLLYTLAQLGEVSPPTVWGRSAATLLRLEMPGSPTDVVPTMTESRDSGDDYRKAINLYLSNASAYDRFTSTSAPSGIAALPALQIIVAARNSDHASLFLSDPKKVVDYGTDRAELQALLKLGRTCENAGLAVKINDPAQAMTYYEAAFSLGWKLYQERLTYEEASAGLELMSGTAGGIASTATKLGDAGRGAKAGAFNAARLDFVKTKILPVETIIGSIDQKILEAHAGDVFYIADNSKERMWRVESVLKLGRYRFNAGRIGDQKGAMKRLKIMAESDNDPVVRAAAAAARDLTAEQYHMF